MQHSTPDTPPPGIFHGALASAEFTKIANLVLRDPNLSFGAKGLFSNLVSHVDGYEITEDLLLRQSTDKVKTIRRYIAELQEQGYVYRQRRRWPAGTVSEDGRKLGGLLGPYSYYVTDKPEVIAEILKRHAAEQDSAN